METYIENIKNFAFHRHDVECNQKYNKNLPYSFHLDMVHKQYEKFKHLLINEYEQYLAEAGTFLHDVLEDARMTYNDLKELVGYDVAEIVYLCTEEKGRTRDDRHTESNYTELSRNKLAVFIKMCDIIANVKFGLLTNSSMYHKYQKDFPKVKGHLNIYESLEPMFNYLEEILKIN